MTTFDGTKRASGRAFVCRARHVGRGGVGRPGNQLDLASVRAWPPEQGSGGACIGDQRDERAQLQRSCHSAPCSTIHDSAPVGQLLRAGHRSGTLTLPLRGGFAGGFGARAARVGEPALPHGALPVRAGARLLRDRRRDRGATAVSRARADRRLSGQARRRPARRLPGLPSPALERAGADQGRYPLRPQRLAGRVRGARDVDDVEVRAPAAALRRRQGRGALRPARALTARAPGGHPPLHRRAAPDHRPPGGHPGAGHGDRRADDGLDDGHLLDAGRLRGPGDRHRQADLDRRVCLPAGGDRRGRRDGRRSCLPAARLGSLRAALRRPGLREGRRRRRLRAGQSAARR